MHLHNSKTIILNKGSAEQKRQEILTYFRKTYAIDEQLYDGLVGNEPFYLRPEPLRHPLIFYFGHTAAFYINKLVTAKLLHNRIRPEFESIFAIGVDEMSWDDLDEKNYQWPSVGEVREYRQEVQNSVEKIIREIPLKMPISWDDPFWIILMGIEHQRIHLETSSVIIRRLPIDCVRSLPGWQICPKSDIAPKNLLLPVPGGKVSLGKATDSSLYGWDNEYGHHETHVEDFSATKHLVSNREYLAFVEDQGYQSREHWTEEGWSWLTYAGSKHPLFWLKQSDRYKLRTMTEIVDMRWDWPVEVNYLEAKAFCNWLGEMNSTSLRLPSEDEWYRLHDMHNIDDQPYWQEAPGNINLEHWASPCPVNHFKFGDFFDLIGNVWQWTETPISGFPGFRVHPYYDDFSTPTFDTRHNLIKGGSWISTGNSATQDARYGFRRHFFQHAGFRYVKSNQALIIPEAMYESDMAVSQYCESHYGKSYFGVDNFSYRCAELCLNHMGDRPKKKALDLGCSVGRTSFELARQFDFVNGLDFSARFIRIAIQMQEKGVIHYELPEEGDIVSYHEKHLADFGLLGTGKRVEFFQADAINLKPQFSGYDLIFAGNLLDRLVAPKIFLANIHQRLNIGGLLILASPYTWLDEFTKRQEWLGGFRKDGETYTSREGIEDILDTNFRMISHPEDIEFVIRETSRKFQHIIAEFTVWERRR